MTVLTILFFLSSLSVLSSATELQNIPVLVLMPPFCTSQSNSVALMPSTKETNASADTTESHISSVLVNGYHFAADAGFPTTGFTNAEFTICLSHGNAADFIWRSSATWVSVRNGVVKFTGAGTGNSITITAEPKAGGKALTYTFALKKWFINVNTALPWPDTGAYCSTLGQEYTLPHYSEMTSTTPAGQGVHGTGTLSGEWGSMRSFGWDEDLYWSSAEETTGLHYYVYMHNGHLFVGQDDIAWGVTCVKRF